MSRAAWTTTDFAAAELLGWDRPIRAELVPGEKLVWEGRPRVVQRAWTMWGAVVFGLIWEAVSLFGLTQALRGSEHFAPYLIVPFLLFGLAFIAAPAWVAWGAAGTCYAITDRRAIVCEPRPGSGIRVRSYGPGALTNLVRDQRRDGSGDLLFEELEAPHDSEDRSTPRRGFLAIDDVKRVETLLRSTLLDDWNRS